MSVRSSRRWAALPAAALLALTVTSCSGDDPEPEEETAGSSAAPAAPATVPLEAEGLPEGAAVGVVVSLASAGDSGAQWNEAAEGAEVAAYRLGLGGTPVDVVAADDRGTIDGAAQAVRDLADQGVAGIVVASSGPHVSGAVDAAVETGVPLLMPYAPNPSLPDGAPVWLTGPSQTTITDELTRAIGAAGVSKPVLVDAGGGELPTLAPAAQRALAVTAPVSAADRLSTEIARLADAAEVDSVVVTGPAARQAVMVRALQGSAVSLPVFLSPDALSPVLARDLVEADGSLSSEMVTVGEEASDVAALSPGATGESLSAYFAAVRAAAADPAVEDFFDGEPFATIAGSADTRSHDAVVALARAAAAAGSTEPGAVADALGGLRLGRGDGLTGSGLDFTSQRALPADQVVALQATSQDPGVRPVSGSAPAPRLFWFAVPRG
ncbi:ABC transporter substrate-binding protein [Nocardioides sp. AX2bis]|uniref:ABC transporter substrate-binding protein n=1 Tax=Nocardioides sp. AX2bis TaxID=2653157 RepID=UPI0012F0DC34|nr:ABC transporter substrate-binding protein [Nocardioides sp. AX2bis]VXC55456.1 conserved exported hypothetical protein [Nocardioides sp. AX2bis]